MRISRIDLQTDDIAATAGFYSRLLGRTLTFEENRLEMNVGHSVISWTRSARSHPVYHFAFNVPPRKMTAAVEYLREFAQLIPSADGAPVVDFPNWNAESIYFFDNNGNVAEFIGRRDLGDEATGRFSGADIQCVSEIGMVVEDVGAFTARMDRIYGLKAYSKQPVLERFAALGDAHGLLIISSEGRNWYPTGIPAEKCPGSATILLDREIRLTL